MRKSELLLGLIALILNYGYVEEEGIIMLSVLRVSTGLKPALIIHKEKTLTPPLLLA